MRKTLIVALLLMSSSSYAQGTRPFLPKVSSDMPDNYGVKIMYVTGKEEVFELASHNFVKETGTFEFVTKDDIWSWVPMSSVQRIEFDKRFSKIMAIREKELQKQTEAQKQTRDNKPSGQ